MFLLLFAGYPPQNYGVTGALVTFGSNPPPPSPGPPPPPPSAAAQARVVQLAVEATTIKTVAAVTIGECGF